METSIDITELCKKYSTRKDVLKRWINKTGLREDIDFFIKKPEFNTKSHGGHNKENIFLSYEAAKQWDLYCAIRKRNVENVKFDNSVNLITRYLPKETEIIDFLYEIISPLCDVRKQFHVHNYRIDLYIVDKKMAIECDEHNHQYMNPMLEKKRQHEIENMLHCKFVRFNPDDPQFKLSKLTSHIIQEIMMIHDSSI